MKDVQHRTALLASSADVNTRTRPNGAESSGSLQQQPDRTSLANDFSLPVMRHDDDPANLSFTHLSQQILQIVAANSEADVVLTAIATALGRALRVDGCLLFLPDGQIARWLAPGQLTPDQLDHSPFATAYFRSVVASHACQTLVPGSLTVGLENRPIHPSADEVSDTWIRLWKISVPTAVFDSTATLVGLATQFQGSINGGISLMRVHPHHWTDLEIEILQTVSHQVASIFSQLQLQKQLAYQSVVNQLTLTIRHSSDPDEIFKLATEGTARALQASRAMLWRLKYWDPLFKRGQEEPPKIRATIIHEWPNDKTGDEASHQSFWLSECAICQQAFLHASQPLVISDRSQLAHVQGLAEGAGVFHLNEFSALLLVALESQGTVLGFLAFQHEQPHIWQPEEIELVELVAAQVSGAIIQTETLRQVQSLVEKRTAELQQSLTVQAKLYERTRQQVDQLRHLNQLKDEFLSTISHELRTPLTSMTMAIRMLRQAGLSSDRSHRYLDILEQQCAQETNLINDLLALQELEAKQVPINLEEMNLESLIQDLATTFNQKWVGKGLTLSLKLPPTPLRLYSDRDSINRILLELLTNAGKYADPNTAIELAISQVTEASTSRIVLTLSNIAPGMSPADLPYIFDKFRRCQGATQNAIQGTGLGLALVKSLVQLVGGSIAASSEPLATPPSHKICFTLSLPQSFDGTAA